MVSWLGDYSFEFPLPTTLKTQFSEVLEQSVDEKYYIDCDESTLAALVKRERERERESKTIRCGGRGSVDLKHTWDIVIEHR